MIVCPGCGSSLKYHIETGMMLCAACGGEYDPESNLENTVALAENMSTMTIFTCSQCGAEIYSDDNAVTASCIYCGSDAVLEQRMEGKKHPVRILPFRKTEADCRKIIKEKLEGFPFAASGLDRDSVLDKLRPVYVPYWQCRLKVRGPVEAKGIKEYNQGDSTITEYYDLQSDVNTRIDDVFFDGSVVFDDTLADEIAPFPADELKAYKPTYLAGFYAENANVESEIYKENLVQISKYGIENKISGENHGMKVSLESMPEREMHADAVMLPVWFTSVRKGSRIAYAAVNGFTGKVHCDIPVSIWKYLGASLLAALPIFGILNALVTFNPQNALLFTAFFAWIMIYITIGYHKIVRRKSEHINDKGYRSFYGETFSEDQYTKKPKAKEKRKPYDSIDNPKLRGMAKFFWNLFVGILKLIFYTFLMMGCIFALLVIVLVFIELRVSLGIMMFLIGVLGMFIAALIARTTLDRSGKEVMRTVFGELNGIKKWKKVWKYPGSPAIAVFVAEIFSGIILCLNPVSDIFYYICTVLLLVLSYLSVIYVVLEYNNLSTRELPFLKQDKNPENKDTEKPLTKIAFVVPILASIVAVFIAGTIANEPTREQLSMVYAEDLASMERGYLNTENGYEAIVADRINLLEDAEEVLLLQQIAELTQYGNIGFITEQNTSMTNYVAYREKVYRDLFGSKSGVVFFIDMTNRKVSIYSDGAVHKVITNGRAESITDNIYQYATDGDFYACAQNAFDQIGRLLKGEKIAQPMKYINNGFLAMIMSGLICWGIVRFLNMSQALRVDAFMQSIYTHFTIYNLKMNMTKRTVTTHSDSGSGGGGGGGGSSGGGGSHSF